jgi:hypothetical protein
MAARIAQFNIKELSTATLSNVDSRGRGRDARALAAAAIVQRVRPDILLINEIDHDYAEPNRLHRNVERFQEAYLASGQNPIFYPHFFVAPCNTGIPSGVDLNGDGVTGGGGGSAMDGEDCFGFGLYPGQFSMALLSRYPIDAQNARTFQKFLWKDLPSHHMPAGYFSPEALEVFRLSSKSHWDVPVKIGRQTVHILASHPTPQAFDGPEERNARRNYDEIRFWERYIENGAPFRDDQGRSGGLQPGASFVVAGDLNCAPDRLERALYDEGKPAIRFLLDHPMTRDTGDFIQSAGALNGCSGGPPRHPERDTIVPSEVGQGARFDYLLPSVDLKVIGGGVFWPSPLDDLEGYALAALASDHRMIWLDLDLPAPAAGKRPAQTD